MQQSQLLVHVIQFSKNIFNLINCWTFMNHVSSWSSCCGRFLWNSSMASHCRGARRIWGRLLLMYRYAPSGVNLLACRVNQTKQNSSRKYLYLPMECHCNSLVKNFRRSLKILQDLTRSLRTYYIHCDYMYRSLTIMIFQGF